MGSYLNLRLFDLHSMTGKNRKTIKKHSMTGKQWDSYSVIVLNICLFCLPDLWGREQMHFWGFLVFFQVCADGPEHWGDIGITNQSHGDTITQTNQRPLSWSNAHCHVTDRYIFLPYWLLPKVIITQHRIHRIYLFVKIRFFFFLSHF